MLAEASSASDWGELASDAIGVRRAVHEGHDEWVATLVTLESYFLAKTARLACGERYGGELHESGCNVRLDLGLRRESPDSGRIVYAMATRQYPDAPDAKEQAELDVSNACELYIRCVAHSKLGSVIPIPNEDWSEVLVYQLTHMGPADARLFVPENLRVYADRIDESLRSTRQRVKNGEVALTLEVDVKQQQLQGRARYLRMRADELTGDDPGAVCAGCWKPPRADGSRVPTN